MAKQFYDVPWEIKGTQRIEADSAESAKAIFDQTADKRELAEDGELESHDAVKVETDDD